MRETVRSADCSEAGGVGAEVHASFGVLRDEDLTRMSPMSADVARVNPADQGSFRTPIGMESRARERASVARTPHARLHGRPATLRPAPRPVIDDDRSHSARQRPRHGKVHEQQVLMSGPRGAKRDKL